MAGRIAYYGGIVKDGLILDLDAAKKDSYIGTGNIWRDVSGNQRNATITSPVFTTEGGGGFSSGTTIYPVVTQASPTELTLEVTLRVATTVAFGAYLRYGGTGSSLNNTLFFRGANGANGLIIFIYGNTTTVQQLISFGTHNVSSTKVLCVSLNNLGQANFYINGAIAQSGTVTNFVSWQIATSGGDIGATSTDYYSNLRVYNKALTAQQVLQNYNATKGRFGL